MSSLFMGKYGLQKLKSKTFCALRDGGAGYKFTAVLFTGVMAYTYYKGPHIHSELLRCGVTGVAATYIVELVCQPIDTLNMKSKVENKFGTLSFLKGKGVTSLMRGIQPVLYGMTLSCFVYFILYKQFKDITKVKMEQHNIDKSSLPAVFAMSAGASAVANLLAIGLYYPFDLIKTRMQVVGEYNYKNVVDAIYKMKQDGGGKWKRHNFYRGFGLFSLTFVSFTTLEFSIYETIMMYLAGKKKAADSDSLFEHKPDKHLSHIIFASSMAGAIGGLLTNPLEFFLVNKQANSGMKVRSMFKSRSVYDIFFKGSMFRTAYYSTQAVLIFFLLEKIGNHLDCEL